MLGRWEWIIIELVVLGLLVAELISVRRSMARDRKTKVVAPEDMDTRK
jgi:hypothetical protein